MRAPAPSVALALLVGAAHAGAQESAAPTRLEPVVVTPTRLEQQAGEAPASVTVITREDVRQSASQTVDDLLRQVPGFSLFRRTSSLVGHPTTQGLSLRGIGPSVTSRVLRGWREDDVMALRHTAPPGGREPAAVPRRLSNGVTLMTLVTQGGSLPGGSARSAPGKVAGRTGEPTDGGVGGRERGAGGAGAVGAAAEDGPGRGAAHPYRADVRDGGDEYQRTSDSGP